MVPDRRVVIVIASEVDFRDPGSVASAELVTRSVADLATLVPG
ncbi:MAG TPA: hypothetical protein VF755_26455 [Catenuloplanes sp.]